MHPSSVEQLEVMVWDSSQPLSGRRWICPAATAAVAAAAVVVVVAAAVIAGVATAAAAATATDKGRDEEARNLGVHFERACDRAEDGIL
jgi:hypothetical protein